MDELAATLRRETAIKALLPLFFVSGATALIYQTIWGRELHLVFGTSTFAIATVLSAFMAGLALGGFWMARWADTIERPLRIYGILEIGIGLYGVLFPTLVALVTPIYLGFWRMVEPGPVLYGAFQFVLVGSTLILPTMFMGATLPILARFATQRLGAAGNRIGTLYAVNTAGAVFGTWVAGFIFLPGLGLWYTTLLAAFCNLVLGAAAWALDEYAHGHETVVVDDLIVEGFHPMLVPVGTVMALAGFASLVYEVAWFRLLGLMLGASVYAFSVMLLAFLTGIAVGGKLGGPLADDVMARYGQRGVLLCLAAVEVGVAVLSFLLMYSYDELPFWYVYLFDWIGAETAPTRMWTVSLFLSGLIMFPPAVLMGAAFPVAVRGVIGDSQKLGGPVGRIYGANTLGGVVGAALAGFVLLPTLQVQGTIFVAGAANLLGAVILALTAGGAMGVRVLVPIGVAFLAILAGALRPPWDPMLMTAGMYKYVSMFSDHSREGILDYAVNKYELVYYREGLSSVVTVAKNKESDNMWLANNGKVDASTTTDMPTQVLCSMLPVMHAEREARDEVLVIGLASGVTAGALTTVDDIERLDVVELEPAIVEAAALFEEWNQGVLQDPRVNLITNDGRNHVLLTPPNTYDVIVSEPSNPWITGVSNLFTREFFELGKSRLKPGGVWSQWVQMYGMGRKDLRSLLRTFAETYEYVAFYSTIEDADIVLVGSDEPLELTPDDIARFQVHNPRSTALFEEVYIEEPLDLVALWQMDRGGLLELSEGAHLNTDDNMRIEYNAPQNLHRSTQDENLDLIEDHRQLPKEIVRDDPVDWGDLARAYYRNGDYVRAIDALKYAMELTALERNEDLFKEYSNLAKQWRDDLLAE